MIILPSNYAEYGGYEYLLNNQTEPLFLKPDGVRTRYPIGWNGYGRYIPGTLRVKYDGVDCNISEEDNGIWYNFAVAPSGNYDDYEVSYTVRPLDYAFSTGLPEGGYEGEEYFLFPNWNNAKGEGDGFWIGKWEASLLYPEASASPAASKPNNKLWTGLTIEVAKNASRYKGRGWHVVRNRQWVSIALWTSHHNIHVKGNIFGKQTLNLDGDYTTLDDCGGSYTATSYNFITGTTIPDTWNHNGKSNGIHHMVGNVWEYVDGIENRNGKIYVFDEDNKTYIDSGVTITAAINQNIIDLTNTSENILNEGIPNSNSTDGYIPSNLDNDMMWLLDDGLYMIQRGGNMVGGLACGLFAVANSTNTDYDFATGFRIAKELI